nr:hypothetical protein [Candidatus Dadabacteria bacterium]
NGYIQNKKDKKEIFSEDTINQFIEENNNITYINLKNIKNAHKWNDIEEAMTFVDVLRRSENETKEIDLTDKEAMLVKSTCKKVLESGNINSYQLERFVDFYKQFEL